MLTTEQLQSKQLFLIKSRKTTNFKKKVNDDISFFELKDLESKINDGNHYRFFSLDEETLRYVVELHNQNKIHLGLRVKTIKPDVLLMLPVIRFANIEIYHTSDDSNDVRLSKYNSFLDLEHDPKNVLGDLDITINYLSNYDPSLMAELDFGDFFALDFETFNTPEYEDYFPLGVGIYNGKKAVYFAFEKPFEEIKDHPFFLDLELFLTKHQHNIWTYNVPFEMACFDRMYEHTFNLQDCYALVLAHGGSSKKTLKLKGQVELGIPPWDDTIDKVQEFFTEKFSMYKEGKNYLSRFRDSKFFTGEYIEDPLLNKITKGSDKAKLKVEDRALLGFSFPKELEPLYTLKDDSTEHWEDRVNRYWGNAWAIVPDSIMGYYCCMDCIVTYHLTKKLSKSYNDVCYDVFLQNMYLKYYSNKYGQINVDWKKKNEVEEYYTVLQNNSKVFSTLMLLMLQKKYFESKVGRDNLLSFNINNKILNVSKNYGSYFYLSKTQSSMVNGFLSLVINKDSKGYYSEINTDVLSDIVGPELFELYYAIISTSIGKKTFPKNAKEELLKFLENDFEITKTIKNIVDYYYESNKDYIKKNNKYIEEKVWGLSQEELKDYILKGTFKSKVKIKGFYIDKFILEKLKTYYVDEVKYRLEQSYIDADYVKSVISYNFIDELIDDLQNQLKEKTITEKLDDWVYDKYLNFYKLTTNKNCIEYGNWCSYLFKDKVLSAMSFYESYLYSCESGFVPHLLSYAEFDKFCGYLDENYDNKMNYFRADRCFNKLINYDNQSWRLSNFYKEQTDTRMLNFCNCFTDMKPFTLSMKDKMVVPDVPIDNIFFLDFFDKIFRLFKFANKELTSAIKFLNNESYNIVKYNGGYLKADKNSESQGLFAYPKIIPLSTKTGRFSANIHTIGGGDDGKFLMINDDPSYIASYFDVSQAEIRMILTMSKDKTLQSIYDRGGDVYTEMAIMAYPYLAEESRKAELKSIRQQYKQVYLASVYRSSVTGIAKLTGLPEPQVEQILKNLYKIFPDIFSFSDKLQEFLQTHGVRKTYFGDRSVLEYNENVKTTSVNHPVQGATTKIIGAGFCNIVDNALKHGLDVKFKYSTHDASIMCFKNTDLFLATMCFRKYFRSYIKNVYNVDFAFDLDLFAHNHRDHSSFKYNHKEGVFALDGYEPHVNKILNGLEKDFEIVSDETKEVKLEDKVLNFTSKKPDRDHNLFPFFKPTERYPELKKKSVVAKLKKPFVFNGMTDDLYKYDNKIVC